MPNADLNMHVQRSIDHECKTDVHFDESELF